MGGDSAPNFLVHSLREKLTKARKTSRTAVSALTTTPKLLRTGFTEASNYKNTSSLDPADSDEAANSSARRSTRSSVADASSNSTTPNNNDGPNPFSVPAQKGRPSKKGREKRRRASEDDNPAEPTPSPEASNVTDVNVVQEYINAYHHDVSSQNYGSRRLWPEDIVNLQSGDEVAIVIPLDEKDESKEVKDLRGNVKERLKTRIARAKRGEFVGLYGQEKEEKFQDIVAERHVVKRGGKLFCEFAGTITTFHNRDEYANMSKSAVDFEIKNGACVYMALAGYDTVTGMDFKLKFREMPAVEIWKKRQEIDSYTEHVDYPRNGRDLDKLGEILLENLSFVEGDVTATYEALYKYYKSAMEVWRNKANDASKKVKKKKGEKEMSRLENAKELLEEELDGQSLSMFVAMADKHWYNAILEHYKKFHSISDELIPEDTYVELFDKMAKKFPLHAAALLDILLHDSFYEPARYNPASLNERKKVAITHFFAMARARNKSNMKYWAMIETLAVLGKGISKVTTRSSAGRDFCCTVQYTFGKLKEIYDMCQPDIKAVLRNELTISFVLDNYQKIIPKRTQKDGKASIVHRATASSVMRNKIPMVPVGSVMISPVGVRFVVTRVSRETPYMLNMSLSKEVATVLRKSESPAFANYSEILSTAVESPSTESSSTFGAVAESPPSTTASSLSAANREPIAAARGAANSEPIAAASGAANRQPIAAANPSANSQPIAVPNLSANPCDEKQMYWPGANVEWRLGECKGLDDAKPISYINQHVPTMRSLEVPVDISDDDLLIKNRSRWGEDFGEDYEKLTVDRYQRLIHRMENIILLKTFTDHVRTKAIVKTIMHHKRVVETGESERYDYEPPSASQLYPGRESDIKEAMLVNIFVANTIAMDHVNRFQSDMIRIANPLIGTQDEFNFFGLHDCDETTSEGALKAFVRAHINMGMLEEIGEDDLRFVGGGRFAFIFGDQLTEQRLKDCKMTILRNLTKIGYEEYVEQLTGAIDSTLLQHDFLHERFHQMQAIYSQYWGGFLQPLACLLGVKRVSGDPMGGGKIIDHHNFLLLVYRALCRYRCQTFLESSDEADLEIGTAINDEASRAALLKLDAMFESYCKDMETSENELSRLVGLFLKKVSSYLRCTNGIRKGDVLLLEAECNDWLAVWKVTGKTNYLAAGLRRIENLYYELHPWLLEVLRINRLPTLNKGRGSVSMDELCELHNLWLKQLPLTPHLKAVLEKSKHLSLIRRCAMELWGKNTRIQSSRGTSTEVAMARLVEFFVASPVFARDGGVFKMEDNTIWELVNVKKDVVFEAEVDEREVAPVSSHEKALIENLTTETHRDIDEGEFRRLLRGEFNGEDDESVNDVAPSTRVNVTGIFDDENPPVMEEDDSEDEMDVDDLICLGDETNRDSMLKKLGNSKHKPLSKQALDDSFRSGESMLINIKSVRDAERMKEKNKVGEIYESVAYFTQERNKRRRILLEQTEKEKSGALFERELDDWEKDHMDYVNMLNE